MTIEQNISEMITKKLEDGTIEKLVEKKMVEAIDSAISDVFRWGDGNKVLKEKISEVMVPVIENHNFNDYTVKLDAALTDIIRNTSLADNKEIIERFRELMKEPDKKVVKLSEIFDKYKEHVADNVDTSGLEATCEEGKPSCDYVEVYMESETEEDRYFSRTSKRKTVYFSCAHDDDEKLSYTLSLYKWNNDGKWSISGGRGTKCIDFNSLKNLSDFEIFLIRLDRAYVNIEIDIEDDSDEIEPTEKPEWDLR